MRFILKQPGCGCERVGSLTDFVHSSLHLDTPTAALFTQGGSVVHITADVLLKVFKTCQLLWMPLSNSYQLEAGVKSQGEGVAKFAGLAGQMTCATLHNSNDVNPSGHFELDKVPLWTKNGKKMITADRYMDVMEIFKPDLIMAIADSRTSLNESFKRTKKAVDRTCNLLDVCVKRYKGSKNLESSALIGVIVGASEERRCENCIKHILSHRDSLNGVALSGLTDGTEDSLNVSTDKLEDIFKKVGAALPTDLIRIVEGCWNPAIVMVAIQHGWDLFDGSYPASLTDAGLALCLNFDVKQSIYEDCILDLKDEKYKDDFRPVLESCTCLACQKHTRAYIRHLLNTREMLSSVLLNIHNIYHFDQMFQQARIHISAKTFEVYRKHITMQYESYREKVVKKTVPADVTDVNMIESMQAKKKICTSNNVDMELVNKELRSENVNNRSAIDVNNMPSPKKKCLQIENMDLINGHSHST